MKSVCVALILTIAMFGMVCSAPVNDVTASVDKGTAPTTEGTGGDLNTASTFFPWFWGGGPWFGGYGGGGWGGGGFGGHFGGGWGGGGGGYY